MYLKKRWIKKAETHKVELATRNKIKEDLLALRSKLNNLICAVGKYNASATNLTKVCNDYLNKHVALFGKRPHERL